jgi:hypothetical protein
MSEGIAVWNNVAIQLPMARAAVGWGVWELANKGALPHRHSH